MGAQDQNIDGGLEQLDIMDDWFKSGMGAQVLKQEKALFGTILTADKPACLVQLGGVAYLDFPTKDIHYVHIDPRLDHITVGHNVCAKIHHLPFKDDHIDMVLCPHVHELGGHSVALFHEIWRVLKPEGKLLLFGFNTFSLWGLQRLLGHRGIVSWSGSFRPTRTIVRMMTRQGFEVLQLTTHCFVPYGGWFATQSSDGLLNHVGGHLWPYSGAIYCLLVTKRHAIITPNRVEVGAYS